MGDSGRNSYISLQSDEDFSIIESKVTETKKVLNGLIKALRKTEFFKLSALAQMTFRLCAWLRFSLQSKNPGVIHEQGIY
jgi:hypothetical protein